MNTKIIKFTAENFKRLQAVEITPEGNLVCISGLNGEGKSSILDGISAAIGGKDYAPDKPIRLGNKKAVVVAELENLIIRRVFTEAGTTLTVTNRDGLKYSSPQQVLDALVGTFTFDPMAFANETDAKKQGDTLKKLVGLDFTDLDQKRANYYESRKTANRELKNLEARLSAARKHEGLPEQEVSAADILREQQIAQTKNGENTKVRNALGAAKVRVQECTNIIKDRQVDIDDLELQIKRLQEKLTLSRGLLQKANENLVESQKAVTELTEQVAGLKDEDISKFQEKINEIDSTNRKIRENRDYLTLSEQVNTQRTEVENYNKKIENIDTEKQTKIAAAKYPVEGLSVDGEGNVLFNGIPFSQASTAQKIKVSVAIGAQLNPKLRVLLVRNGNDLDTRNLKLLAEIAQEKGLQVWCEAIDSKGLPAVIIEDGMVAGSIAPTEEKTLDDLEF